MSNDKLCNLLKGAARVCKNEDQDENAEAVMIALAMLEERQQCETEAVRKAVKHVSEKIAAKSKIAETMEQRVILDHKIDVILAFESYAKELEGNL